MAINPETQYPGKTAPSSPEYPYGAARNITLPGDGTGTPWEAALVNDLFGFQQALLGEAAIVPNGNPDEVGSSQYLTALLSLFRRYTTTVSALTALSLPSGREIWTLGYRTAGDAGTARYLIKTAAEFGGTPDEFGDHTLANGNIAVLQPDGNGRVFAEQYGAGGDPTYTPNFQTFLDAVGDKPKWEGPGISLRYMRRWRAASKRMIAAATATFSDSVSLCIGMRTLPAASANASVPAPAASPSIIRALGCFQSTSS